MGPRQVRAAYLDASAFVKLVKREPETRALEELLAAWPVWVSSEVLTVEARCTARRLGDDAMLRRVESALAGVDLVRYSSELGDRAGRFAFRPPLRALDAIHVATALTLKDDLGIVVAYDQDMSAASDAEGLPVTAPA